MADFLDVLERKEFEVGDSIVLYVNRCSDVDPTLIRGFYEGTVTNVIEGRADDGLDRRYIVACMHNFRGGSRVDIDETDEVYEDGRKIKVVPQRKSYKLKNKFDIDRVANQVAVSEYSPFLMSPEEYIELRSNPELTSKMITAVTHILMNEQDIPDYLKNWQSSTIWIMEKLGITWKDIASEMTDDFNPRSGLKLHKEKPSSVNIALKVMKCKLKIIQDELASMTERVLEEEYKVRLAEEHFYHNSL